MLTLASLTAQRKVAASVQIPLGYNADRALAKQRKSGLRSCSALSEARRAILLPVAWRSINAKITH